MAQSKIVLPYLLRKGDKMEVICYICGKLKRVHGCSVKNIETYHCKKCHGEHIRRLYEDGKIKRTPNHLGMLKALAEKAGDR